MFVLFSFTNFKQQRKLFCHLQKDSVTGLKSKAEGYHCITQYLKFISSDSVVLVKFGMSLKSHRDIFIPQRARREEYQE